ncbi:MAG TPA: hypothetical protein DCS93_10660 [Microscillaceae bacterium]|nr:hypothetical protein [Microscillaceae bacterium]
MSIEFLIKYLMQQTSEVENKQVEDWLQTSEKNQTYLNELRGWFEKDAPQIHLTDEEIALDWQKVKAQVKTPKKTTKTRKMGRWWITRIAAVILIGLAIGLIYTNLSGNEQGSQNMIATDAQKLKQQALVLADGSKVWLNEGSRLHYPPQFGQKQRLVRLEGEGFFEVQRDEARPFKIQTGKLNVTVLGTSFNIRQQGNTSTQVMVSSGKVAVATQDQKQRVELIKGDMSNFDVQNGKLTKQINRDLNYLSWKTNTLVFKKATMGQIVADLSRHFKVSVNCTPALRQKFSFNGTFKQQSLDKILQVIELTLDVQISKQGNSILIR